MKDLSGFTIYLLQSGLTTHYSSQDSPLAGILIHSSQDSLLVGMLIQSRHGSPLTGVLAHSRHDFSLARLPYIYSSHDLPTYSGHDFSLVDFPIYTPVLTYPHTPVMIFDLLIFPYILQS